MSQIFLEKEYKEIEYDVQKYKIQDETKDSNIKTCINLNDKEDEFNFKPSEDIKKNILDLTLSEEIRFENIYQLKDENVLSEIFNILFSMYCFTEISVLGKFISRICQDGKISCNLRLQLAERMYYYDEKYLSLISLALTLLDNTVSTPCIVSFIIILHKHNLPEATIYLKTILNNKNIDSNYKYNLLLKDELYDADLLEDFFYNNDNDIKYRILASQYMVIKFDLEKDSEQSKNIVKKLFEFGNDKNLDMNTRADAFDVISRGWGDPLAKTLLLELGQEGKRTFSIYDNSQNVHMSSIEKSVEQIFIFLESVDIFHINNRPITFEEICEEIKKKNENPKIEISLQRIDQDRGRYYNYMSLKIIFTKLYSFIRRHSNYEELFNRLEEELIDMSSTCSSGFLSRIANVISGFTDFNIEISWLEQITANVKGRLNARLQVCENKDEIIEQMMSDNKENRKAFSAFFIKNISSIQQEMYQEFKDFMDNTTFDLYFSRAILAYDQ